MAELKKILFAFEAAEISDEIAPWVELLASRFDAEVQLLHVVPALDYFHTPYSSSPQHLDNEEVLKRRAHALISKFCAERLDVPIKIAVQVGRPVEVILEHIKTEEISLVVVGTQGRSGLDRRILGSVTDRLLRLSPVPVLCIRPSA
jgi:nucleotide-binding universal stress UspA family protein